MNKDLHNIDDVFNSAYREFEDDPSPDVWQKINEGLDKKDTDSYKKRFIIWKRSAMLLVLLLAGFVLYESKVFKQVSGGPNKNTVVQKINTSVESFENDNTDNNSDAASLNSSNPLFEQDQKNMPVLNSTDFQTGKIQPVKKASVQKNNPVNKQSNALAADITSGSPVIGFRPDKEKPLTNNIVLPWEKTNSFQPIEKNNIAKTAEQPANNVKQSPLQAANDSSLKNNTAKKEKQKKKNSFKPFWMISPFVSYEQTGYKLDSDDPLTADVIRHREVHEPSFSGGLFVARQFTKHWSLRSGLVYTSTQIGISPQKMYALQLPGGDVAYKFITSSGYAYIKLGAGQPPAVGDSITTSDAKHLLKHISVPLSVKYKMGKNKLTVSPSAGIEANFITSAKVEVGIDLASNREIVIVNKLKAIRSFYLSAVTGVEASYRVSKKMSVNVQPVFRYALSPITKNNVVETFPRSFGIGAGVTIKL